MKIEEFKDIKIAYMRRVGKYGLENKHLMETFKAYLKAKGLLKKRNHYTWYSFGQSYVHFRRKTTI
ncbi:MAG: hypothetical protein ACLU8S_22295 [Coprococcus phoceensis]